MSSLKFVFSIRTCVYLSNYGRPIEIETFIFDLLFLFFARNKVKSTCMIQDVSYNANEYMNVIYLNRGERYKDIVDHRSKCYVHNLRSCEIKSHSCLTCVHNWDFNYIFNVS